MVVANYKNISTDEYRNEIEIKKTIFLSHLNQTKIT